MTSGFREMIRSGFMHLAYASTTAFGNSLGLGRSRGQSRSNSLIEVFERVRSSTVLVMITQ
jgi:hypothetical protein